MKRTPLTRKAPLRRRARLRAVGNTKYRRRARDFDFMAFVLTQPCSLRGVAGAGRCVGRVQADHQGTRGLGQKAADDTCVALCQRHHECRTDYRGYFKGWGGARMRAWCDQQIYLMKSLYQRMVELGQTTWRKQVA